MVQALGASEVVPRDADLTLFGCTSWGAEVFADLVGYLERGEIVPTVAATFPLGRIAEAQAAFESKRYVGKFVLTVPSAGPSSPGAILRRTAEEA